MSTAIKRAEELIEKQVSVDVRIFKLVEVGAVTRNSDGKTSITHIPEE